MYNNYKIKLRILIAVTLLIGISFSLVSCEPDNPDVPPTEIYDD